MGWVGKMPEKTFCKKKRRARAHAFLQTASLLPPSYRQLHGVAVHRVDPAAGGADDRRRTRRDAC